MIELKRILLPTDFSENSQQAVAYGCALAEQFGSELHVLHIVQDLVAMVPEPGLAFPPPGDYVQEMEETARAALSQIPDASWAAGKTIVRVTRQGTPFVEIVRY